MIDNAEKRRSAAGVPFLPLGVGVTPNVAKDEEWREQVGWSYSGIATPIPPAPPPIVVSTGGAGSYPSDYRLTQRLTRGEWLKLLYGPDGPTFEQLSDKRLQEFLEDDDLTVLMLL